VQLFAVLVVVVCVCDQQTVSLWPNTLLVGFSSGCYLCSTSKWKTSRFLLRNSIRLTVTVYSPPRELTVVFRFIHFGWKLVEISLLEGRHDRAKISIFIVVLARVPPVLASQGRVFRGFSP